EPSPRTPATRFTYASGARPLDGYVIKRGVGRGGFGEVYFAVSDAGKEVALKLIRRNLEVELRGVTHCLNLKHPNLIDVYDIRTDEHGDHWVVMEYVSGASLEDVIQRHPDGLPRDMVLHWFEGICAAVAYLHDRGIVHRDLKPANIFLDEGRVKIGDYGLSKFISCSRRSGQTESVGTVHYMAPEIANGRYGREIDAYALGIILYEMLTGHVPFEGESVGEVLMKHLTAEPDLSRLEEPFLGVVRGAMAKDPDRRINNVARMAAQLRGAAAPVAPLSAMTEPYVRSAPSAPVFGLGGGAGPAPEPDPALSPGVPSGEGPEAAFAWREFLHRDPDPVLVAVRRGWAGLIRELGVDAWPAAQRTVVAVIALMIAIPTARVWLPAAISIVISYVWYRVIRFVLRLFIAPPETKRWMQDPPYVAAYAPPRESADSAAPAPAAASGTRQTSPVAVTQPYKPRAPWRRRGTATWRQAAYSQLAAASPRDRASALAASLLAAAGVAAVASLLVSLFTSQEFNVELFLWMAIVAAVASWGVIVPAQLLEGRVEDQAPMRFLQLIAGALVGVIAWGVAQALYLELPVSRDVGPNPSDTIMGDLLGWQGAGLDLPLPMFAAYFAFLFALVRWWRQAEWTRPMRVNVWAIAWCVFAAWLLHLMWWFPQPLGMALAGVISFSVQLASPWLTPSRRKELAQAAVA
ncbi:MAG TPA: serine/threonine-protein kinase, partial [Lacipirellulaceae bacterium]|nr:serine/threonine-protein kinase [Lacipirellulaceae bacterium]